MHDAITYAQYLRPVNMRHFPLDLQLEEIENHIGAMRTKMKEEAQNENVDPIKGGYTQFSKGVRRGLERTIPHLHLISNLFFI